MYFSLQLVRLPEQPALQAFFFAFDRRGDKESEHVNQRAPFTFFYKMNACNLFPSYDSASNTVESAKLELILLPLQSPSVNKFSLRKKATLITQ